MYDQDTVTKTPPAQPSSPSPADGSTEIPLETAPWLSVTVTDPDGNSMDVSFYDASTDTLIGTDANVESGGTAQVPWHGLVSDTAYTWYAEADDGFTVVQSPAWTFTTGTENYAPDTPKEISPCGGPVAMDEPALLSVKVTDPNGDDLTVRFYDDTIGGEDPIGSCTVASGETASFSYDDHLDYTEWHVEVSSGQETTVSQGYWFAAWEEAYIFDPTGELSGYDWIWYEYPFEGETKTAMCRIKEMEEWVVSAIDALYPDMDDIDDGRGRHELDEHAINGEDEELFAEEAERNNKYIFVPYTGASYDYADEVVFGDKDGEDPEDPENYPYGYGPIPLGRICDFNVENSLITDPAEETRIDSFFRRFKIKTVEHCSEGMELTDPIYVDFKVCGHGLDDVGAKGATVEMQLVSYTAIGEGEDYQCVYVSKKMYALVGGDPAECVYLPDEKTTDDVEYIRGALPTIQIFGKNVWDTPGLEFFNVHYSEMHLRHWNVNLLGLVTDLIPGLPVRVFNLNVPVCTSIIIVDNQIKDLTINNSEVGYLTEEPDKIARIARICLVDEMWAQGHPDQYQIIESACDFSGIICVKIVSEDLEVAADNHVYRFNILDVDIAMDGNRDGTINFNDPEDEKYLFWVNDDRDYGHENEGIWQEDDSDIEDDEDDSRQDCNDDWIGDNEEGGTGIRRDLEDFTQLHILIDERIANLSDVSYHMKFENCIGKPKINIFQAVKASFSYLSNSGIADAQKMKERLYTVGSLESQIAYEHMMYVNEPTPFLIEGKIEGKGFLSIIIKNKGVEICKKSVYLDLRSINTFYNHYKVELSGASIGHGNDFVKPLAKEEAKCLYKPETDEYVLFIHGYNLEPWERKRWAETMFKRLWWLGYKGHFGFFEWPSLGQSIPYDRDEFRAYNSATPLLSKLLELNKLYYREVRILAHSMGNTVASEALRLWPLTGETLLHTYISTQSAVPGHCYDNSLTKYWSGYETPNIYGYYFSGKSPDAPYFNNISNKADVLIRYYNIDDWALSWSRWPLNNQTKPDSNSYYSYKGRISEYYHEWDHFYYKEAQEYCERILEFEDDKYEILSRCVESRSLPIGRIDQAVNGFEAHIDLGDFGYDDQHYAHSRQFRSNVIDEISYWKSVIECMNISRNF